MKEYYENYGKGKPAHTVYTMDKVKHLSRIRALEEMLKHYAKEGDNILDIGCNDFTFKKLLPQFKWEGLDCIEQEIEGYVKQDLNKIPYPYLKQFDHIVCTEVLEHLWAPENVYKEIGRLLKRGGFAFVSTPNFQNLDNICSNFQLLQYDHTAEHSKEHIRNFSLHTHDLLAQANKLSRVEFCGSDASMSAVFKPAVETLIQVGICKDVTEADMLLGRMFNQFSPGLIVVYQSVR